MDCPSTTFWSRPHRTSPLTPYYPKLRSPKHFRVVSIFPGQWKDPIRCSLLRHELDRPLTAGSYKALSYVWGSSVVKDIIYVEDCPVEITFNLFCALHYLRQPRHSVAIWVDALCINQQDDEERSQQVSLMRLIYEHAEEVIVFIGDGRSHRIQRSDLTESPTCPKRHFFGDERDDTFLTEFLDTCRSARLKVVKSPATAGVCAVSLVRLFSDRRKIEYYFREILKLRETVRRYLFECLKSFLVCPWWERIWVVQEVAVSKDIVVKYGTVSACWKIFIQATDIMFSRDVRTIALAELEPENLKVLDLLNSQLSNLERTRHRWKVDGATDLVHLLREFSNRKASDDRDKVYGLLSLAKQGHAIKPNYTLDVFWIYRNTFLGSATTGPYLACWAGDQKRKNRHDLPSWIPDWSSGLGIADRRRMAFLDTYKAKTRWTLKVIHEEEDYWYAVGDDMRRLTDDLKKRYRRLPRSLVPTLHWYIRCLEMRMKAPDHLGLCEDCFPAAIERLLWCEREGIFPRLKGNGSIQSQISRLQRLSRDECAHWLWSSHWTGAPCPPLFAVDWLLSKLPVSSVSEHDKQLAQRGVYWIESLLPRLHLPYDTALIQDSVTDNLFNPGLDVQKRGIRHALLSLIDQCRILISFCSSVDDMINPWELFGRSYTFQKNVSWMSSVQRMVPQPHKEDMSWYAAPPIDLPIDNPARVLTLQTIHCDRVKHVGPRMFGWSDKKAATQTLMDWMYLVGSQPEGPHSGGAAWLDSQRLLDFARTITGRTCFPEFQSLTDWLESLFLQIDGAHVSSRRRGAQNVRIVCISRSYAIASFFPSYVSESLAPPSPFFEAIELATEGRVFFVSEKGTTGLGPASMQPGDTVHMFPSGPFPVILRDISYLHPTCALERSWREDKYLPAFELIGDCYINTDDGFLPRGLDEDHTSLEGSLPFELLGAAYLKDSQDVQTITLF